MCGSRISRHCEFCIGPAMSGLASFLLWSATYVLAPSISSSAPATEVLILWLEEASFDKPSEFAAALRKSMSEARDIEILFAIWEQNVDTVRALNKHLKQDHLPKSGVAPQLVAHLKRCAIALVKPHAAGTDGSPGNVIPSAQWRWAPEDRQERSHHQRTETASDAKSISALSLSSLVSFAEVAIHAHHIRYAQPKGLALKVSDEFTVPLCAIHHSENHTTGDERRWWQERNLPIPSAWPIAYGRTAAQAGEHTPTCGEHEYRNLYRPKAYLRVECAKTISRTRSAER